MANLEAVLRITAQNDATKVFEAIKAQIATLEKSASEVERVMLNIGRVTNEASLYRGMVQRDEMDAAVANMERLIRLTEKAAAAQRALAQSAKVAGGALASEGRGSHASLERAASAGRGHGVGFVPVSHGGMAEQFKGILPFAAVLETFEVGKKVVEDAAAVEKLRARVRGLSKNDPSEAAMADRIVEDVTSKYPNISREKAYDNYLETRGLAATASGAADPAKARRNMMDIAQAQTAALASGFEFTAEDAQNLMKATEGAGRANDPNGFHNMLDQFLRRKQISGSAIQSSSVRDFVANAKSSVLSLSDAEFYGNMFGRMTEGNASRLGNEANQTLQTIAGGHMSKTAGNWLVDYGLAQKNQLRPNGPGAVAVKGGVTNADVLQTAQGVWAATTLRKAIEAHGDISDDKVNARMALLRAQDLKANPNAVIDDRALRERAEAGLFAAALSQTGWKSTVTDNLAHFIANQSLLERDNAMAANAPGFKAANDIGQNPVAAFAELTTALSNFGTVLGGPAIANAGPLLDGLAKGITSLTDGLLKVESMVGEKAHALHEFLFPKPVTQATDFGEIYEHAKLRQADNHPIIWGERDMEGARAGALSRLMDGGHTSPQEVDVHGEATVTVPVSVTVTASSELISAVQDAKDAAKTMRAQMSLNPVAGGHSGRMNSDAMPLGRGGIWDR